MQELITAAKDWDSKGIVQFAKSGGVSKEDLSTALGYSSAFTTSTICDELPHLCNPVLVLLSACEQSNYFVANEIIDKVPAANIPWDSCMNILLVKSHPSHYASWIAELLLEQGAILSQEVADKLIGSKLIERPYTIMKIPDGSVKFLMQN